MSARCLLRLQHDIAKLESEIEKLDDISMRYAPGRGGGCGTIERDTLPRRNQIVDAMIPLLQQYYDLVNAFAEVKARPTTQRRHMENLTNWFDGHKDAIHPSEQHFRNREGDLFPIVSRDKSPLRMFLGNWRWLRFRFKVSERDDRVKSELTTYTSSRALDRFTSTVILIAGLGLLFGPMWWLNFVSNDMHRLAIITGFIAVFTGLVWTAAGQRPFEILGATAAYAAVLMVFLQSNGGGSSPGGIAVKVS